MSNLPNNIDQFQRVAKGDYQENIHSTLHNQLAETLEAVQKYSGAIHVSELPASSEVGMVYTLINASGENQPGIYLCVNDDPTYLPLASRGEGYVRQYDIEEQTTVVLEHGLSTYGLFVKAYDVDMNEVEYDELTLTDEDTVTIKFSVAFTGKLILLAGGKDGLSPEHQWDGPRLRFKNPNGSWGEWIDLSGVAPGGPMGPMPAHEWNGSQIRFQEPGGEWGAWVNLVGPTGATGPMPTHEWNGKQIRFQLPGGTWGPWVDVEGEEGQGLVWKNTYSALVTYDPYDLVHYNGSAYIKILESGPGFAPTNTTYWSLYAAKGQDGNAGVNTLTLEAGEDILCEGLNEVPFSAGVIEVKVGTPVTVGKSFAKSYLGFEFNIAKVGTPIGASTFRFYKLVDGIREEDPIISWVFNASEITNTFTYKRFYFDALEVLDGDYEFEFETEAGDASNYIAISADLYNEVLPRPFPVYIGFDGKAYVSQETALRDKVDGFVGEPKLDGDLVTVTIFGIQHDMSDLIPGKEYYLSDLFGQITDEVRQIKVGKAITDTQLLIQEEKLKVQRSTGIDKNENGLFLDVIDPDNPVAQSPAKLIGGNDVVSQNFIDLGLGDNDGAFKATIDGVEYDDIGIEMYDIISDIDNAGTDETEELAIGSTASNEMFYYPFVFWQTFTMPANVFIKKIKLYQHDSSGSNIKICLANSNDTLESTTALATGSYSGAEGEKEITLSSPVYTGKTQRKFAVVVYGGDGSWRYLKTSGSRSYMDGRLWNYDQFKDKDLYLKVITVDVDGNEVLTDLASELQTAIRARTSKLETVVWDTDHFEITSTILGKNNGSQVLKLQPPTTGTDISGAGYLDLGANATEVAANGDDYKLVRLDEDGQVPLSKLTKLSNQIGGNQVITGRALNTVYQNTSTKTKIVLVSTLNSGYNSTSTSDSIAYIGATSTPNILVGYYSTIASGNNRGQLCMLVPPGYYYTITATKGGSATLPSLVSWFECDLI